jgi:chromosome segregation ATPase
MADQVNGSPEAMKENSERLMEFKRDINDKFESDKRRIDDTRISMERILDGYKRQLDDERRNLKDAERDLQNAQNAKKAAEAALAAARERARARAANGEDDNSQEQDFSEFQKTIDEANEKIKESEDKITKAKEKIEVLDSACKEATASLDEFNAQADVYIRVGKDCVERSSYIADGGYEKINAIADDLIRSRNELKDFYDRRVSNGDIFHRHTTSYSPSPPHPHDPPPRPVSGSAHPLDGIRRYMGGSR